jgi:hypothetical protein
LDTQGSCPKDLGEGSANERMGAARPGSGRAHARRSAAPGSSCLPRALRRCCMRPACAPHAGCAAAGPTSTLPDPYPPLGAQHELPSTVRALPTSLARSASWMLAWLPSLASSSPWLCTSNTNTAADVTTSRHGLAQRKRPARYVTPETKSGFVASGTLRTRRLREQGPVGGRRDFALRGRAGKEGRCGGTAQERAPPQGRTAQAASGTCGFRYSAGLFNVDSSTASTRGTRRRGSFSRGLLSIPPIAPPAALTCATRRTYSLSFPFEPAGSSSACYLPRGPVALARSSLHLPYVHH